MQSKIKKMWASKLGIGEFDTKLFSELFNLLCEAKVDYTMFFRELSNIPDDINPLTKSFYNPSFENENIKLRWTKWFEKWKLQVKASSCQMKQTNPKYILREWHLVSAYKQAQKGDYKLIEELQEVMTNPYDEQSSQIEEKYYDKKPSEFFGIAGISHVSCSS